MAKQNRVVITKQRTINMYAELWHASGCVLEKGIDNPEGSAWQFLSSAVLTAFAFEAYLNHAGAANVERWNEHDREPPLDKLKVLCEELNVHFPEGSGARPLQTARRLFKLRNAMAHGRTALPGP